MTRLGVHDLTKLYPGAPPAGVGGVTCDFSAGRVTTILGPSGCGKTTLLLLVAGLLRPDRGGVWLGDLDVTDLPPERRGVGVVFQDYALFPHLSVRGNVEFGLRRLPRRDRRRRAEEMLDRVRVLPLADRRVGRLSGGEQQRVALARAMAPRPRVLLLDEPLSALDAPLRERLRGELRDLLLEAATTTLYVTHDRAEALGLGEWVVVMNAGRVVQAGPPREVYERPGSRFVARFLGAANVVEGEVDGPTLRLPFVALAAPAGEPPGPCGVVLRADALEIVAAGAGDFDAAVTSVSFLGDRLRLSLRVAGLDRPLEAEVPADRSVTAGERLGVRIARGRLVVLRC